MYVGPLGVVEVAEQAAAGNLADDHVRLRAGVVLPHHVDRPAAPGGAHELLALLEGHARGHLAEDVNAALEGHDRLGRVERHRRADDHGVDEPGVEHRLGVGEGPLDAETGRGLGKLLFGDVAERGDGRGRVGLKAACEAAAAAHRADDAEADRLFIHYWQFSFGLSARRSSLHIAEGSACEQPGPRLPLPGRGLVHDGQHPGRHGDVDPPCLARQLGDVD